MIFYFSGTGNSLWAAKYMADFFLEELIPIADYYKSETAPRFSLKDGEKIGFIFPVHSWGIPMIVKKFLQQVEFAEFNHNLIYTIVTCGDECGATNLMVQEILAKKGMECRHIYSVQMPNTYIVFPGFDVDKKELEKEKKMNAQITIQDIARAIMDDQPIQQYVKGNNTFLKSSIIYPLFMKFALSAKPFHTSDKCIACGLCAKMCPTKNIEMCDGQPHWGNDCTQCLACIHRCPVEAIEYGRITQKKKRYFFS